jgi:hypothetical protein
LYSWFSTYTQDCLATSSCQKTTARLLNNRGSIVLQNLVTIGATNMISSDKDVVSAKDNQAVDFHPYWSQISRFEAQPTGGDKAIPPALPSKGTAETDQQKLDRLRADLSNQENCYRAPDCVDLDNPQAGRSLDEPGWVFMGYDQSGCKAPGGRAGKPICCKAKVAPESCTWRANLGATKTDCNGRCNAGEAMLFESGTGGMLTDSNENQCVRGHKSFCCKSNAFDTLRTGCEWTDWTSWFVSPLTNPFRVHRAVG